MGEIDFSTINETALAKYPAIVEELLPGGRVEGHEFKARNPTRADARPGSFSININTGVWSDFATGDKGKDPVSLWAYVHGISQGEAAKMLGERVGVWKPAPARGKPNTGGKKEKKKFVKQVSPVPADAPEPRDHYEHGKPSKRWAYLDQTGGLIGYVCRFDLPDGSKQVLPLVFAEFEGGGRWWTWKSFAQKRPLYGLEKLAANPDALVAVVEGEKCADALQALFDPAQLVSVAWPGGGKAVKLADFGPLRGRRVGIWPDNDEPGVVTAADICKQVEGLAASVSVMKTDLAGRPKGWDIADAVQADGWGKAEVSGYLKDHLTPDEFRAAHADLLKQKDPPAAVEDPEAYSRAEPIQENFEKNVREEQERLSDAGNGRRLVRLFGDRIRFFKEKRNWLIWTGQYWCIDHTLQIIRYAKQTAENIYDEARHLTDWKTQEDMKKFALKSESQRSLEAMVETAKSETGVIIQSAGLDTNPYLLNLSNGTVDLKSGELRNHDRSDFISKISAVDLPDEPGADCPLWETFLYRIFDGDVHLIRFMQRTVGYSLTGSTDEQCMFYLYGSGANGKSVFLNILAALLGDYCTTVTPETFMARRDSGATPELAKLPGVRGVIANEVGQGRHLDEALVKQFTGKDYVSARSLYQEPIVFRPEFKLFMAGNYKPNIKGTDDGIWRRIHLIPFAVTIPPGERDSRLEQKLIAELPEIMRWAIAGCLEWRRQGLNPPDVVSKATSEYRDDMDTMGRWLSDCCVEVHAAETAASDLYASYKEWAREKGHMTASARKLGEYLQSRSFQRVKKSCNYYRGIGLKGCYSVEARSVI